MLRFGLLVYFYLMCDYCDRRAV